MKNLAKELQHPIFRIVSETAGQMGVPCYVIGGFVRDLLLRRPCKDIDIVAVGDGVELARQTAARLNLPEQAVNVFKHYGTAMFRYENMEIEFVGARKESYSPDSRNPSVTAGTLEDDQFRRDFTINALAISLSEADYGTLLDPFQGLEDLQHKIIRTPLDPEKTFSDDPLRIMRAIRFASQLNFSIDMKTLEAIHTEAHRLEIVSKERIVAELNKILLSRKPSVGFTLMDLTGVLDLVLPWVSKLKGVESINNQGHKDNFYHTMEVVDKIAIVSDNLWLCWTALLHDIGKPQTKRYQPETGWTFHQHEAVGAKMVPKIFRALKMPLNEKMDYVKKLVYLHLRPIALVEDSVTDSAVRRLLFDAGDDIDDLMLLCEADITSKNQEKVKHLLRNFEHVRQKLKIIEEKDRIRNFQPPIDGLYIMQKYGLQPCKEVGMLKNTIREAILDGVIGNNFEEAYRLLETEAAKLGLKAVQ
ncbi:MAG: HD domain-containing protein [Bacteroidales bacterium]|nr:HD domain-containing protein [Bacteroidales bacterium]